MADSDDDINKASKRMTVPIVPLLLGMVADFFLAAKAFMISEPLTLFLIGTGLIMVSQFGKRLIEYYYPIIKK